MCSFMLAVLVFTAHRGCFLVVVLKLLIVAASLVQLAGSRPVGSGVVVLGLRVQAQCLGHRSSCSSACGIFSDFPGKSWKPLKKWLGVNCIYRRSLILILKYIDARNGELWALLERDREMAGTIGCQALVNAGTRRFLLVPSVPKSPQTRVEFCVCFI